MGRHQSQNYLMWTQTFGHINCMLAGINADDAPPTSAYGIRISVRVLNAATRWWHEYGYDTILLKDVISVPLKWDANDFLYQIV